AGGERPWQALGEGSIDESRGLIDQPQMQIAQPQPQTAREEPDDEHRTQDYGTEGDDDDESAPRTQGNAHSGSVARGTGVTQPQRQDDDEQSPEHGGGDSGGDRRSDLRAESPADERIGQEDEKRAEHPGHRQ